MTIAMTSEQAQPAQRSSTAGKLFPWLVFAVLAALPWLLQALELDYYIGFVNRLLIMMMAVTSLNFILGYGGLVALGHAGFIGVGAYTVVACVEAGYSSAWAAWLMALAVSGVAALLIGLVALRTRGVYFIMITLAFAEMLHYLAMSLRIFGGDDGYSIYTPLSMGGWLDDMSYGFYGVVLVIAALVFALNSRLEVSKYGYALKGTRDNETRMGALGFPVFRLRLVAFVGAGAVAGLCGGLLASNDGFVSPSLMLWTHSAVLIVMVVIGGVGNRWGGVIGAGVWLVLEEVLRMYTDYWHWPMGLLLLFVVFVAPKGIAAWFETKGKTA